MGPARRELAVEPGEALGIVGENGSGKSTLLKLLAGIIPPHEGRVEVGGRIASMLELGAGFHPDFTGRENVYMNGAIQGLSRREVDERMEAIIAFSELEAFIDNPVRTYSSGMYTRLGFAVASHVDSDVLLLDEVLAVGDEAFQRKCLGRIFEYRRGGGTVVFVSHDAEAVERVCDRAVLLEHGELVAEGRPGDVLATYRRALVREARPAVEAPAARGLRRVGHPRRRHHRRADRRPRGADRPLRERRAAGDRDRLPGPRAGCDPQLRRRDPRGRRDPLLRHEHPPGRLRRRVGGGAGHGVLRHRPAAAARGALLLTVAVTSADESEVYHWIDRRFELSVFARGGGVGIVRFDGRWSVREEPSGARTGSRSMAEPPVIDVEALVEDLRTRVARAKAEGLYADDLSGSRCGRPPPRRAWLPARAGVLDQALGGEAADGGQEGPYPPAGPRLRRPGPPGRRRHRRGRGRGARGARLGGAGGARRGRARERIAGDVAALAGRIDGLEAQLGRLQVGAAPGPPRATAGPAPAAGRRGGAGAPARPSDQGVDYLAFEARFRGDEETVRERQEVYRRHLEGRRRAVDLGADGASCWS